MKTSSEVYRAILGADRATLAESVTDEAMVAAPGHIGTGVDHLVSLMQRASRRSLRTWNEDSADVLESEHHTVVLDRWLAEDGSIALDEHITLLLAARDEDGRFGLVSIYGFDGQAIGRFFDE